MPSADLSGGTATSAVREPSSRRRARIGPVVGRVGLGSGPRASACWGLGVGVLGTAWLLPETPAAALGWIAALLMVYAMRAGGALWPSYLGGAIGHVIGFHWVFRTVLVFGGCGWPVAALVFATFVGLGALQFLAIAVIDRHLDRLLDALAIRSATAVVLAEWLTPRLFPWHFGHTQIAFTPMAQSAGLGGALLVSFLVFWIAEVVVRVAVFGERRRGFLVPSTAFGGAILYGLAMMDHYAEPGGRPQEVVLAQSTIADPARRDLDSARRYQARLVELTRGVPHRGALVVWPEGAVPSYIPAGIGDVGDPPRLPCDRDGSAYLVGGYSFLPDGRKFNAAFAIHPDGEVPLPYFKRVLIPFGEAMPLASAFPWLHHLNRKAGVFSAGEVGKLFEIPMRRPDGSSYSLKVAPLICYEDTLPSLARQAARDGAELLVNLTSDAWFGRSLAPHQHHLIAAFRAIENRRYLVRATTTGLTAIVDPLGRTIATIPPSTEGTAKATVRLLADVSPYTAWVGDRPWRALLTIVVGLAVSRRVRDRVRRRALLAG